CPWGWGREGISAWAATSVSRLDQHLAEVGTQHATRPGFQAARAVLRRQLPAAGPSHLKVHRGPKTMLTLKRSIGWASPLVPAVALVMVGRRPPPHAPAP